MQHLWGELWHQQRLENASTKPSRFQGREVRGKVLHSIENNKKNYAINLQICGFRFHTKAKLRRHMKSHTGERNYECSICFKKFLYSYNVVAHVRNVHEKGRAGRGSGNLPYACIYCPEKFWRPQKLNDHLLQIHQIEDANSKDQIIEENIYE